MATAGTQLVMKFGTTHGDKNWTFKYAKNSLTSEQVRAVAQAMIENGSIYYNQPLSLESAEVVVTTVNSLDVS